jgi:hypothetical protein
MAVWRNWRVGAAGRKQRKLRVEQRLRALEERLDHVEAMLEGLQDSVHRESVRRGDQIDELQKSTTPGRLRRTLNRDARERGL